MCTVNSYSQAAAGDKQTHFNEIWNDMKVWEKVWEFTSAGEDEAGPTSAPSSTGSPLLADAMKCSAAVGSLRTHALSLPTFLD